MSAAGWLAKSSFGDECCPLHLARTLADFCFMDKINCSSTHQWFQGRENKVADMLLQDFAPADSEQTQLIKR
jgi:hypothetical protein